MITATNILTHLRLIFILFSLSRLLFFVCHAQQFEYYKYFVRLKDKNYSPYSIERPTEYLSARAIERRQHYGIPIDEYDLPVSPSYLDSLKNIGITLLYTSRWLNAAIVQLNDSNVLSVIRQFSFVRSVEPVYGIRIQEYPEIQHPTAIVHQNDQNIHFDYGQGYHQIGMLKADYLHRQGYRGTDIWIAVLDAGFKHAHQISAFDSLFESERFIGMYDFVAGKDSVFDSDSHGTHVLSVMASNLPGQMIGTAPQASYILLRTEDAPTEFRIEEYFWIVAAEYADSIGADIINSSLGYSEFDDPLMSYRPADMNGRTTPISQAATIAARKGIIIVSSAGNAGNSVWRYITAPADADSILAVGAVDANGVVAAFSSRGPSADGRIKPDVVAQGVRTTLINTSGQVSAGNGTSFSAPLIAGAVACLWQAHRDKNNIDIIRAVKESAHLFAQPNDSMGYGIPDFRAAHLHLLRQKGRLYQPEWLPIVYPNPFSNHLQVIVYVPHDDEVMLSILGTDGKTIYQEHRTAEAATFVIFNIEGTSAIINGLYYIQIRSTSVNKTIRALKIN